MGWHRSMQQSDEVSECELILETREVLILFWDPGATCLHVKCVSNVCIYALCVCIYALCVCIYALCVCMHSTVNNSLGYHHM